MRFSIIVPVYNVEPYLDECLESIANQDFRDFECILVDDGSTDGSGDLCGVWSARDARFKVIHQRNAGLSAARNSGIRNACGEYLLFVDSDDFLLCEDALSCIDRGISDTDAHVVIYGYRRFYGLDCRFGGGMIPATKRQVDTADVMLLDLMEHDSLIVSACCMAVERSFLLENGLFFKEGIKSEDIEWSLRLFCVVESVAAINRALYAYRQGRAESISSTVDYAHLRDLVSTIQSSSCVVENASDGVRRALRSYLTYQAVTTVALSRRTRISKEQRQELDAALEPFVRRYLPAYALSRKTHLASAVYRLGGYRTMAAVLGFYLTHRGR